MSRVRIVALALAVAFGLSAGARAQLVDGVAAIVDDEVILLSEVALATQGMVARAQGSGVELTRQDFVEMRRQALEGLIDQKLMSQVAESNGMATSESELDQAIEGIATQEGLSVDDVYSIAARQGMDRETYREQLAANITRMKILGGAVRSRIKVSDEDLAAAYQERYGSVEPGERLRVLHMLLPVDEDAPPEFKARALESARQLRERALETGDFAGLARQFSAAPSAAQGGMTVFQVSQAPRELLAALEGLTPGEISEVVANDHGLNLFQFLERFDPSQIAFEDVRESLEDELIDQRTMPEFEKWLADVRENRYIEVVHPDLK